MSDINFKSYQVKNYKSIKNSGEIKIPGISVFLGENSSGKTNILESLRLLKQSYQREGLNLVLNGEHLKLGEYRDIIHKKEVDSALNFEFNFHREDRVTEDEYECPVCNSGYTYEGYYTNHLESEHPKFWKHIDDDLRKDYEQFFNQESKFSISYSFNPQSKNIQIDQIKLCNPIPIYGLFLSELYIEREGNSISLIATDLQGKDIVKLSAHESTLTEVLPQSFINIPRSFGAILHDILPEELSTPPPRFLSENDYHGRHQVYAVLSNLGYDYLVDYDELKPFSENQVDSEVYKGLILRLLTITEKEGRMLRTIDDFLDNINHIGPLRRNPQRIYFGSGGAAQSSHHQGINIEDRIFKNEQTSSSSLIDRINNWLNQTGFDCELEVTDVGVGDLYQLDVKQDGLSVNLADAGFGLSQTLPIIVECVNMALESNKSKKSPPTRRFGLQYGETPNIYLTLIEEPEIHLNPRIEADMGDFFIKMMESEINLMIETHSEHLLNRIQRRVADGTVKDPQSISIYFVEIDDNTSDVQEISISEDGKFDKWPEGFFQDDFEEAIEILKESMELS